MSTSRGRPPRGFCLAGGIIGPTMAHCSSVRSDGYFFRDWFSSTIDAHSSTDGICANYLINLLFCQVIFSDSLLLQLIFRPSFFNSFMAVLDLTCNTRVISRMPLAFRAISTICFCPLALSPIKMTRISMSYRLYLVNLTCLVGRSPGEGVIAD